MKSYRRYQTLVIAAIAIAAMGQPIVRAQNTSLVASASASTTASGPGNSLVLSGQHHWQSFLKLAGKPNAIVTVKDLESAFGQKAVHQGDYYRIQGFVTLAINNDRFARKTYPDRPSNFVSFEFPSESGETCITRSQVIRDLQMVGWVLHAHSQAGPIRGDIKEIMPSDMPYGSYTFMKGDQGVFLLGYSEKTNCAMKVTMESDRIEFERIIHANATEGAQ